MIMIKQNNNCAHQYVLFLFLQLVANGAKVVLSGRRESELHKVKNQCLRKFNRSLNSMYRPTRL